MITVKIHGIVGSNKIGIQNKRNHDSKQTGINLVTGNNYYFGLINNDLRSGNPNETHLLGGLTSVEKCLNCDYKEAMQGGTRCCCCQMIDFNCRLACIDGCLLIFCFQLNLLCGRIWIKRRVLCQKPH